LTLWDLALAAFPQWHEHFEVLQPLVSTVQHLDPQVIEAAQSMGDPIMDRVTDSATAPGGLYGYGLWSQTQGEPVPAIFAQPGLAPRRGAPASVTPVGAMLQRMNATIPDGTIAVALLPPQPQTIPLGGAAVGPCMTITIGSRRATLGLKVHIDRANRSILTAGHAAPSHGALVRDEAGDLVGTVILRLDLDDVQPGLSTADVAVVAIDDRRPEMESDIGQHVDAARALDEVRLGTSDSGSWVRGLSPSFSLSQNLGAWGHVAITAEAISQDGDSGAPVRRTDGAVVGQIVAGYGSAYSLVQDAEYTIAQAGAVLR
jgi:hypothetical protein